MENLPTETGALTPVRENLLSQTQRLQQLHDSYSAAADEEERELYAEAIEGLASQATEKVDGVIAILKRLEAHEAEAARLAELQAKYAKERERLKNYVREVMVITGTSLFQTPTGSIKLQGNGGLAPLILEDPETIPGFMKYTFVLTEAQTESLREVLAMAHEAGIPAAAAVMLGQRCTGAEPDNALIRSTLEKGGEVKGARIGERGKHIRINGPVAGTSRALVERVKA